MPLPTAAQITAADAYPSFAVFYRDDAGTWIDVSAEVVGIPSVQGENAGNLDNPLTFGDYSELRGEVELVLTPELRALVWPDRAIRIEQGFAGANVPTFEGPVVEETQASAARRLTLRADGYAVFVKRVKTPTPPVIRRRAFTRTGIASVENPAAPGYQAGYGNRLLWDAGGRPIDQAIVYGADPARKFWYACDDALIDPPYAWALSGEDHWSLLAEVARAAGGQVIQRADGVIQYWNPFHLTDDIPAVPLVIDESAVDQGGDVRRARTAYEGVGTQIVRYVQRAVFAEQEIYKLDRMRIIPAGGGPGSGIYGTVMIRFTTQYPIFKAKDNGLALGAVVTLTNMTQASLIDFANAPITPARNGATGNAVFYEVTKSSAQDFELVVKSSWPRPIQLHDLRIRGYPICPVLQGEARDGTAEPERVWEDNPLIQDPVQAQRFAAMSRAFYGQGRPIYEVSRAYWDPRIDRGSIVALTDAALGVSGELCMVASRTIQDEPVMDLRLVPLAGIPRRSEFYRVGETYGAVWSKKVVW